MKDIQQLIKKNSQEGRYEDIFPKTFIDAVTDKETREPLGIILNRNNFLFLTYVGSESLTRLQVPMSYRRSGLWVAYQKFDKTLVVEFFKGDYIDNDHWGQDIYWFPYNTAEYQPHSVDLRALAQDVYDYIANSISTADNNLYTTISQETDDKINTATQLLPEDLSKVDGKIQLADRQFNTDNFSGLGYIILRKNIVDDKNVLTQAMINKPSTVYEIRYDFDLNNQTITIPKGCVLNFNGGSFTNGNIVFNNAKLMGSINFSSSITPSGEIDMSEVNVKWFGAKGDGVTDDTKVLNWAFNIKNPILIPNGVYNITNLVFESNVYSKIIRGTDFYLNNYHRGVVLNHKGSGKMLEFKDDSSVITIENIIFNGNADTTYAIYINDDKSTTFFNLNNFAIRGTSTRKMNGIKFGKGYAISLSNFEIESLDTALITENSEVNWVTPITIGENTLSYIIRCNKVFSFQTGAGIHFNQVLMEACDFLGDITSLETSITGSMKIYFSQCYVENIGTDDNGYKCTITGTNTRNPVVVFSECDFYAVKKQMFTVNRGYLTFDKCTGLDLKEGIVDGSTIIGNNNQNYYTGYSIAYNDSKANYTESYNKYTTNDKHATIEKRILGLPDLYDSYVSGGAITELVTVSNIAASELKQSAIIKIPILQVSTKSAAMFKATVFLQGLSSSASGNVINGKIDEIYQGIGLNLGESLIQSSNKYKTNDRFTVSYKQSVTDSLYTLYVEVTVAEGMTTDIRITSHFEFSSVSYLLNTPKYWGLTTVRPTLDASMAGFRYRDVNLAKWIKWDGTVWVNLDGTSLN